MARNTDRFGLMVLEGGNDDASLNGYQFTSRDRELIDRLLRYAVEEHRHTGLSASSTPLDAPELVLDTSEGGILSGERVYYRYTLVDEYGIETGASGESYIDTPEPVAEPDAPGIDTEDSGGTHIPGTYFYALSAYVDFTTSESLAGARNQILVPIGTNENQIVLDLPSLPDGATGFNIYRRAPGRTKYFFLEAVDMDVATPPTEYVDDNSVDEDCDRTLPVSNTTFSTNSVEVSLPGLDPEVPEGYTWKVYRTYIADDWGASFLHWVVEETEEDSGIISPVHIDTGEATENGAPPETGQEHGSPPKISLTDAAEVEGVLPPGLNVVPFSMSFAQPGVVVEGEGEFVWRFPFDFGVIVSVTANLGRSSAPAAQEVIVDVNKYDAAAATPAWATIFTTQANRPTVDVGEFLGDQAVPDVIDMLRGDALCVDIDQNGGGATQTDSDLVVTIEMLVQSGSRTVTTDMGG